MNVVGVLFWVGLVAASAAFGLAQVVGRRNVRSALNAFALFALFASSMAGAAWATTSVQTT